MLRALPISIIASLLLALTLGVTYAQDDSSAQKQVLVADEQRTQAEKQKPPVIQFAPGDLTWQPPVDKLAEWIDDGVQAAADEVDFPEIPLVIDMKWRSYDGIELPDNRSLRFANAMTPQLAALIVGFASAWDEGTWVEIQENRESVVTRLVNRLTSSFNGEEILFPVVMAGPRFDGMLAAIYFDGQWHYIEPELWGPIYTFSRDSLDSVEQTARWAARYIVTQEARYPALQIADSIHVYLCHWYSEPDLYADADFVAELPIPDWSGRGRARLALGSADRFAWVDFELAQ